MEKCWASRALLARFGAEGDRSRNGHGGTLAVCYSAAGREPHSEDAMNVETILRTKGRDVATISPLATIKEALQLLAERDVGALVVSEDGRTVLGVLSERDIVRGLAESGAGLLQEPVGGVMTRRVHSCAPDDAVEDLMSMMTQRRIRHLPVIRDGVLCGIVSIGDVVKNRLDEIEFEASSLRSMITG